VNRKQQQAQTARLRRRDVELGESNDSAAIRELLDLTAYPQPTVRRSAASGIDIARLQLYPLKLNFPTPVAFDESSATRSVSTVTT
jgi:hypothetical protein